jgi:hypothetical protein
LYGELVASRIVLVSLGTRVLGKARSHRNEHAQPSSRGVAFRFAVNRVGILSQNAYGQRIGEDIAAIQLIGGSRDG